MGFLRKLLGMPDPDEFRKGKPTVVFSLSSQREVKELIEIANKYGYKLSNMTQSKDPNPFAVALKYTLVFQKTKRHIRPI